MNRISFCRASLIALVVGLTLAVVSGLTAWVAGAAEPALPATGTGPQPWQTLSAPGVVTGTVYYAGTVTGTHLVWAGAFTTTLGGPPAFATMRSGPGPYTITVAAGVYHIYAGMDTDPSDPPDPAVDPMGVYAHNPVTVTDGALITGVDILLLDPAPPPTGTGSIQGVISYTGHVTGTHHIIVFVSRQGEEGPPAYATVIPGPGPYTITNVADYTYTAGAFMDLGDDMGPPQPGEPFGWYDPAGDGWPDPVIVSGGNPVTGVNITLHDPRYSLYLPLVMSASPNREARLGLALRRRWSAVCYAAVRRRQEHRARQMVIPSETGSQTYQEVWQRIQMDRIWCYLALPVDGRPVALAPATH